METYVLLMRADRGASLGVLASGEAGAAQQKEAVVSLGGNVVKQWAVAGRFDIVLVAEFPNAQAMLGFSLLQNGAGLYCEALPAFEPSTVSAVSSLVEAMLDPANEGSSGVNRGDAQHA